jgi:hypothetical protein
MNREALEAWADALQFGEYRQTIGDLTAVNADGKREFCAMGVACDQYAVRHNISRASVVYEELFMPEDGNIPGEIEDWLGVDKDIQTEIIHLNDQNLLSLPQIGSWVRDHLLKEE